MMVGHITVDVTTPVHSNDAGFDNRVCYRRVRVTFETTVYDVSRSWSGEAYSVRRQLTGLVNYLEGHERAPVVDVVEDFFETSG